MGILGLILLCCLIYGIIATGLWQYVLLLAVAVLGIFIVYWVVICVLYLITLCIYAITRIGHNPYKAPNPVVGKKK